MSRDSQWNRLAAMPKPMTVIANPKMILTGTKSPRLSDVDVEPVDGGSASATGGSCAVERIVWPTLAGVVQRQNISFPS